MKKITSPIIKNTFNRTINRLAKYINENSICLWDWWNFSFDTIQLQISIISVISNDINYDMRLADPRKTTNLKVVLAAAGIFPDDVRCLGGWGSVVYSIAKSGAAMIVDIYNLRMLSNTLPVGAIDMAVGGVISATRKAHICRGDGAWWACR